VSTNLVSRCCRYPFAAFSLHILYLTPLPLIHCTLPSLHTGSTCTTGVHRRTDNPTEKPNTLIIFSFSLFFNTILYRKKEDLRSSCFLDFQLPNSHTKAHQLSLLQKVCAATDSAVCPSPICSRSSSASSADNVGYLAKLYCPFCPPSLPNLSPLFTSHFIEFTCVTFTMTSLALSASSQSTSNKNGGSVIPKLPIPLFLDMSSSLHTECITDVLVSSRDNYRLQMSIIQ